MNKSQDGFNAETFLLDAWLDTVKNAADACRDLGLIMWINSDIDYPTGDVAGMVEKILPQLKTKRVVT